MKKILCSSGASARLNKFLYFAVVLVLTGAGCSTTKLHVTTEPRGALVSVTDQRGKVIAHMPAPLDLSLSFSSSENYTFTVKPPTNRVEQYLNLTTNVSEDLFATLPPYSGNFNRDSNYRELDLKLDEKRYTVLPYVEVVLDANRVWVGEIIQSRSYKDISEAGGTVPTQVHDLGDNMGILSLALSPDGKEIVYSEASSSQSQELQKEEAQKDFSASEPRTIDVKGVDLKGFSTTGGGVEQITSEDFRDMFPSFSPDGQYLYFTSNRRRPNSEDILRISAQQRSGISDIYVHRDARLMRPTQAKDGTLAFCMETPNPQDIKQRFTIWTLGGPNQFPTQIAIGKQPAISPDGKRITYIGADGNLWVIGSDGSQATQLTFGSDKILQRYTNSLSSDEFTNRYLPFIDQVGYPEKMPFSYPAWSNDGQRIVYTGMEGSDTTGRPNEDIWIMNYDGSNKQQLTTNGSIDRYPLLSPDGKWVYFMSNRGGRWAIWRIAAPAM